MGIKQKFQVKAEWVLPNDVAEAFMETAEKEGLPDAALAKRLMEDRLVLYRSGWGFQNDDLTGVVHTLVALSPEQFQKAASFIGKVAAESGESGLGARGKKKDAHER